MALRGYEFFIYLLVYCMFSQSLGLDKIVTSSCFQLHLICCICTSVSSGGGGGILLGDNISKWYNSGGATKWWFYVPADHAQPRTGIAGGSACRSHFVCGFLIGGMFVLDLYAVQLTKNIFVTFISSHIKIVCLIRHLECFTLYPVFERFVGEDLALLFGVWVFWIKPWTVQQWLCCRLDVYFLSSSIRSLHVFLFSM
jgi:hypothetical protein